MNKDDKGRETIFDHGVTREELDLLFGGEKEGFTPMTKEKYFKMMSDTDAYYVDICRLYKLRGDRKKMMKYYKKISMPEVEKMWLIMDSCYEGANSVEEQLKEGRKS